MIKLNILIAVLSIPFLYGCQTVGAGKTAQFIKDYPTDQNGNTVTFGSERVNVQKFNSIQTTKLSFSKGRMTTTTKSLGEIAHLYRKDGEVLSVDLFSTDVSFSSPNAENKRESLRGNRDEPLMQIAMFYDKFGNHKMSDVKLNKEAYKKSSNGNLGDKEMGNFSNELGDIFGQLFKSWNVRLKGKSITVGTVDKSISELTADAWKVFTAKFPEIETQGNINIKWEPRLEYVEGDKAIFLCRKSKGDCSIKGNMGEISGSAVCDARYIVSLKYAERVSEEYSCDAKISADNETGNMSLMQSVNLEILR